MDYLHSCCPLGSKLVQFVAASLGRLAEKLKLPNLLEISRSLHLKKMHACFFLHALNMKIWGGAFYQPGSRGRWGPNFGQKPLRFHGETSPKSRTLGSIFLKSCKWMGVLVISNPLFFDVPVYFFSHDFLIHHPTESVYILRNMWFLVKQRFSM